MKKTILVILLLLGMMFIANTQQAWAIITLDFNMDATHPLAATIYYTGINSAPLVGSDISVDTVMSLDDHITHNITEGILSFTTGGFTGSDPGDWYFSPGGSIELTGGILDLGIPAGTTLLTGSFSGTPRVIYLGGTSQIVGATFIDSKDSVLARWYGLSDNGYGYGWAGDINLSFAANGSPDSAFSSTLVKSGDITNTPIIPEPGSMMLLGMGILGLFGLRKKA